MIIKLLLKIWPALLPILIYCLWILAQRIFNKLWNRKSARIINATYQEVNHQEVNPNHKESDQTNDKINDFSLQNHRFIVVLYLSFFVAIICFLFFAIRVPLIEDGKYVPAHMEEGKIVPGAIISPRN